MKPKPPSENDLLEALLAAKPLPPGPEWHTMTELVAAAKAQGQPIGFDGMRRRIHGLLKDGKLDKIHAPRRGVAGGTAIYYRLKGKS